MTTQTPSKLKGLLSERFPSLEINQVKTTVQIIAPSEYTEALIGISPQIAEAIGGEWDVIEINGHELTRETISAFADFSATLLVDSPLDR